MWTCQKCKQVVEDDFEVCWNCGTTIDGREDSEFRKEEDSSVPGRTGAAAIAETETDDEGRQRVGLPVRQGCIAGVVLSVAALLSLLGCLAAVLAGVWYLANDRPLEGLVGAPLAFVYQAAMFFVFTKVQRI